MVDSDKKGISQSPEKDLTRRNIEPSSSVSGELPHDGLPSKDELPAVAENIDKPSQLVPDAPFASNVAVETLPSSPVVEPSSSDNSPKSKYSDYLTKASGNAAASSASSRRGQEPTASARQRYNAKFAGASNAPSDTNSRQKAPSDSARSKYYEFLATKSDGAATSVARRGEDETTAATSVARRGEDEATTSMRARYDAKFGSNERSTPSDTAKLKGSSDSARSRYYEYLETKKSGAVTNNVSQLKEEDEVIVTARERYNAKFSGGAEGIPAVAQTAPGGAWAMAQNDSFQIRKEQNTGRDEHCPAESSNNDEENPGITSFPRARDLPREETRPGAVRVAGWQDEAPYESDDDDDDVINEPVVLVPELSAVLATGNVNQDRQELQQLRERMARAVEAQAVRVEEEERGNSDDEESKSGTSDPPPCGFLKCGLKSIVLWCVGFFLVASAVVVGFTVGLRAGGEASPPPTGDTPSLTPVASTLAPAVTPPSEPTPEPEPEDCVLTANASCWADQSVPCSEWTVQFPVAEPCYDTPYRAGYLLNGGGCDQSDNADSSLNFTCNDTINGPPPVELGSEVYVIVTDSAARGFRGRVYFQGFVTVGDLFYIEDPERGLIDVGIRIAIFRSDDIRDPANLLQEVHHHDVLCSKPLEMANRFGAVQMVEYDNDLQGTISMFTSFSFAFNMEIAIDIYRLDSGLGNVMLTNLTALTNFAGFLDLSDQVAGYPIQPGDSYSVILSGTVDGSVRKSYGLLTQASALAESTGRTCTWSGDFSFDAGWTSPTVSPSTSMSFSPSPSPF